MHDLVHAKTNMDMILDMDSALKHNPKQQTHS